MVKQDTEKAKQDFTPLDPNYVVQQARQIKRLTTSEIIAEITDMFYEMHGDRKFGDDQAIYGGVGKIDNHLVTIVGTQKGHTIEENIQNNFGSPHAEGYRKAIRLFEQAEKFQRPVITFINTSGAFCDIEAEDRGIGEAIAKSIQAMGKLTVPSIAILIGEGGSGGALALATSNTVWIMEQAMYSILSPEGFSTILWKDSSRSKEAADLMKITATDLRELGIVDDIIAEIDADGNRMDSQDIVQQIKAKIIDELEKWQDQDGEMIRLAREQRFQQF